MTIGSLGYVFNDALVRRITEDGPDVYQVLCVRSIGLAALFAAVGRARGEHTRRFHFRRPLLIRVAAETVASAFFFAAIVRLEFANAQAILQVVPFAVTLAAALVLGEHVRMRQYIAIVVGFVGVMIVVRPATDGFSVWSLAVIASAGLLVVREYETREVDADTPALSIAFTTAVGLAAFRYAVLVGAVVFGYLMFDEVPDRFTVVGSLVIVATGVYAVHLERAKAEHPRT